MTLRAYHMAALRALVLRLRAEAKQRDAQVSDLAARVAALESREAQVVAVQADIATLSVAISALEQGYESHRHSLLGELTEGLVDLVLPGNGDDQP